MKPNLWLANLLLKCLWLSLRPVAAIIVLWRYLFPSTLTMGRMALQRGQFERAEKLAHRILQEMGQIGRNNWDYGNKFFAAHELLGLIELRRGNLKGAKKWLRMAAKTPGSPQLNSGGANHVLAYELLQSGEREAVLEYLRALEHLYQPIHIYGNISNHPVEEWQSWIEQIERGETPRHRRWHPAPWPPSWV